MKTLRHWSAGISTRFALRGEVAARGLTLSRTLKASPETSIMEGQLDGRKVIVKRMQGPDATARSGAQADELALQHPRMSEGAYRVPKPILTIPGKGIVVMEQVDGMRLDQAIREDPSNRASYLRGAGGWLAHYTALRRVEDSFGGGFWIKTRREAAEALPHGPDKVLIGHLITLMERERARIGPKPLTRTRSHGDFCALNPMVDGDIFWGLDIHNSNWIALTKDLARFLVYLEITQPHGSADGPCGLAADDVDALLGAEGLIRRREADALLPFFCAVELSGRLLTERDYPDVLDNARALADRMLDRASG